MKNTTLIVDEVITVLSKTNNKKQLTILTYRHCLATKNDSRAS